MKNRIFVMFLFCTASVAGKALSWSDKVQIDSLKSSHHITYFGNGERSDTASEHALIDVFYYDQFRHFQDPRAPYFLFMSKDARLAMGIGGVVRMRGWEDWGGVIRSSGFIPYDISVPKNPVQRCKLGSTPAGTAIFFRVFGRNDSGRNFQLYIEANFNGYESRGFHLKKSYAVFNDWTIGYTHSTFDDPKGNPPVVDAHGPNAEVKKTTVLVRWMHEMRKHWVVAASLEMPESVAGANDTTTLAIDDWFPNVAAFLQYEWGHNDHIRLSGLLRLLPYRDLLRQENVDKVGWGVQLGSSFHVSSSCLLYLTANTGCGYGSLVNDLLLGRYDLIDDPGKPGRMYAPWSFGWFGAVQYYFRLNLFATAMLSENRYAPQHSVIPTEYKYGLYSAVNIFWDITPRIQTAAELNLGKRQNFDGNHNWARRACLLFQFSF